MVNPPLMWVAGVVLLTALSQYILTVHLSPILTQANEWDFVSVTDLDLLSRDPDHFLWNSVFQAGSIHKDNLTGNFTLTYKQPEIISSNFAVQNRSMELSALEFFQDELLGFCDRSGAAVRIDMASKQAYHKSTWYAGSEDGGRLLKTEWATVKDEHLYIGSFGKDYVVDGVSVHRAYLWVKRLSKKGKVVHLDWTDVYAKMNAAMNLTSPGYMIHEAVTWDAFTRRWYFLPRKFSQSEYSEQHDERQGTNLMFVVSEDLQDVSVVTIGVKDPEWGFSDVKVLPGALHPRNRTAKDPSLLMALKTKEVDGIVDTQVGIFDTTGKFYTNPPFLPFSKARENGWKFEGLALVPYDIQVERMFGPQTNPLTPFLKKMTKFFPSKLVQLFGQD